MSMHTSIFNNRSVHGLLRPKHLQVHCSCTCWIEIACRFVPCGCLPGGPKWHTILYALTSSYINRFSKLFHYQNQEKISLKIPPHLATLPYEMSSVLKATIENKTTSITTHFKEINHMKQRVYCISY